MNWLETIKKKKTPSFTVNDKPTVPSHPVTVITPTLFTLIEHSCRTAAYALPKA